MPTTVDFPTLVKQALALFSTAMSLTTNPPGGILLSISPV